MDDDDPDEIEMLLLFLYTLEKPSLKGRATEKLLKGFVLADKYDVPELKNCIKDHLIKRIKYRLPRLPTVGPVMRRLCALWLVEIWSWPQPGADDIRNAALGLLPATVGSIVEDVEAKRNLMRSPELMADLISAMAKQIDSPVPI